MNSVSIPLKIALRREPDRFCRTERLFDFMRANGSAHYDEVVTQLEHSLQCAELAARSNARDTTIIGALLHDFGHFLQSEFAGSGEYLVDDLKHEIVAAEFMDGLFPESVIAPVRYHVLAKRYLCSVDRSYHDQLSPASQHSLQLQGGLLSPSEVADLGANPNLETILQIRRWDDLAKRSNHVSPPLEAYTNTLASVWL